MKILILAIYYNRPKLLKNAMRSILKANEHHNDWELIFGDDNSPIPGQPIVEDILKDYKDRITFVNTNISLEEKLEKGIMIGKFANEYIKKSNADIAITLCDDDELEPYYLKNISNYFENNIDQVWCYSHLAIFNPFFEKTEEISLDKIPNCVYNFSTNPINPVGKLDSSQIAYKLSLFNEGIKYPETSKSGEYPWLINPDLELFEMIYAKYGECHFTGFVSQFKGVHDYQLVWNKKKKVLGLKSYIQEVHKLAENEIL